jgi:glutamine synthetase
MSGVSTKLPEGTHTIVLGAGDANGIMRGKRIPASHWSTICESGAALSLATLAIDMNCDVWDTPYTNFDTGYPDMHLFPDGPAYAVPWEEGVAFCFGKFVGGDHKPVPIDPRNALIKVLARAKDMGYEVKIGAELEFYLLDPETLKPKDSGIQVYGLARAAELEHVLGPIRRHLNDVGIPIEQSNPEYAAGQVEVNIRYGEALESADRAVAFRSLVKELAVSQNYIATFMSKPFFEESGSGFHLHHSLWKDGKNVFSDGGQINELGLNYLAGMQKRMAEMALASATTPNAYRRRQPYTFCPINNAWGGDNRTVGLRVIDGSDTAVRVEKRDGSADCNPYYLMACEIAAGLEGIEQGMTPSEKAEGNAYESEDAEPIPTDLQTAIDLAKESSFMSDVYGEDALGIQIQQAERELEFFASQVTQVEVDRYMKSM